MARHLQIGFVLHDRPALVARAGGNWVRFAQLACAGRRRQVCAQSAIPNPQSEIEKLGSFCTIGIRLERWNDGILEWWGTSAARNWVRFAHFALRGPGRLAKLGSFCAFGLWGPEAEVCPQSAICNPKSAIEKLGSFCTIDWPQPPGSPEIGFVSHDSLRRRGEAGPSPPAPPASSHRAWPGNWLCLYNRLPPTALGLCLCYCLPPMAYGLTLSFHHKKTLLDARLLTEKVGIPQKSSRRAGPPTDYCSLNREPRERRGNDKGLAADFQLRTGDCQLPTDV